MKIDEQKLNPGLPKLNKTFFRKPKKRMKNRENIKNQTRIFAPKSQNCTMKN